MEQCIKMSAPTKLSLPTGRTEPVLDDWLDAYIDWTMVSNSVNYQAAESRKQCLYCQEQL